MMVGRLLSFWDGIFSGAMLNFQGVTSRGPPCRIYRKKLDQTRFFFPTFFRRFFFPSPPHLPCKCECEVQSHGNLAKFKSIGMEKCSKKTFLSQMVGLDGDESVKNRPKHKPKRMSGQIITFHQPRFPSKKRGFPFQNATFWGPNAGSCVFGRELI